MLAACQNCDWTGSEIYVKTDIPHLSERVAPGEPMPLGECPECGALCHPQSPPVTLDLDLVQRRLIGIGFGFHEGVDDDDPDTLGKWWWTWQGPGDRWDIECGQYCDSLEAAVVDAFDHGLISYAIECASGEE